ncbi:MAG: TnsA-like heteromeric transposase endonuclease subunit [Solirubrobacteraceae bacterium]
MRMPARVSLRLSDRSTRQMRLSELSSELVLAAVPWRTIRSHRGQRHLPGLYWSSTTGGHVVYESRLELARLLLADADPSVVGIAAQPFLVWDEDRRHVPDFLLARVDGSVAVVNVKPADRLKRPPVAEALSWAGEVFAGRGWEHEVWSAADPMMLANVRFLAGYRRSALLNPDSIAVAVSLTRAGQTIADAEATLRAGGMREPRPVVLHLVWSGVLRVDLTRPVTSETELAVSA